MIACIFSFGAGVALVLALREAKEGNWSACRGDVIAFAIFLAVVVMILSEVRL